MNKEEMNMVGFEIVAYSGDARSTLLQLLKEARQGNFANVDALLADADENINLAHRPRPRSWRRKPPVTTWTWASFSCTDRITS